MCFQDMSDYRKFHKIHHMFQCEKNYENVWNNIYFSNNPKINFFFNKLSRINKKHNKIKNGGQQKILNANSSIK